MPADTTRLAWSSQDWKLRVELGPARQFALADVDGFGADQGAAPADAGGASPTIAAFDGITSLGTIGGSIAAGGWSCEVVIPEYPANFEDFYQVDLWLATWYGGVPGVVGAAGIDPDEVRIFRGYMQEATGDKVFQGATSRFAIKSPSNFLQESSFSRGIDWATGLPHGAPGDSDSIIAHLIEYHTNYFPRDNYGIYIPNHSLDAFSVNEGSVFSMLQSLADNFCLAGDVYARREGDLVIGCHPNIYPDRHANIADPIIEFTDDIVMKWEVPEVLPRKCASCTVVAQLSDQTEYTATYYGSAGLGSRPKFQIRTDDTGVADYLAAAMFAHLNRRFRAVKVTVPLNVAVDLGDCVTCTVDLPQRGISWSNKKFYTTEVQYQVDFARRTFQSVLTLDEVLEGL